MIHGELISLRPFTRDDLAIFEAWANDLSFNTEFNSFGLRPAGELEAGFGRGGLLDARQGMLVIVVRSSGAIAGELSYHQVRYGPNDGSQAYNIGITLAPAHRGHGYGVEAQRLLAQYLFDTYPVQRIEAQTDSANTAEQRALTKAGFTREGVARGAQWRGGAWHDLVVYSKLRGE